jgi:hypothetical protein
MKLALALTLLAACGAPPKKESPIVNEGSAVPESCCCITHPLTSADGKPVYEMTPRMECSTQQGECVPDVQCSKQTSDE